MITISELEQNKRIRYVVIEGEEHSELYSDIGHVTNEKIVNQILEELELDLEEKLERDRVTTKALGRIVKKLNAGGGAGSVVHKRMKIRRFLSDNKDDGEYRHDGSEFKKIEWFKILHYIQSFKYDDTRRCPACGSDDTERLNKYQIKCNDCPWKGDK